MKPHIAIHKAAVGVMILFGMIALSPSDAATKEAPSSPLSGSSVQAADGVPTAAGAPTAAERTKIEKAVKALSIPFVANAGQADPKVAYYAQTFAGTVFVTKSGEIVYSLPAPESDKGDEAGLDRRSATSQSVSDRSPGWVLTETMVGGRPKLSAKTPSATNVSYFLGSDKSRWTNRTSTYDAVQLGEVWPGVEVSLKAYGQNVEKLFSVQPGTSANVIRLKMGGAKGLRVSDEGALVVTTGLGEIVYTKPVAWQEKGDARLPVEVAYRLTSPSSFLPPPSQGSHPSRGRTEVRGANPKSPTTDLRWGPTTPRSLFLLTRFFRRPT